jgi:hypothetical protein
MVENNLESNNDDHRIMVLAIPQDENTGTLGSSTLAGQQSRQNKQRSAFGYVVGHLYL